MDIESGYSEHAIEKYYGFDPGIMPEGGSWTLDLSGLYAGIALSFFF